MATANGDRNLLFGILALQMDFVTRDALVRAMNAWVLEKTKMLGQILREVDLALLLEKEGKVEGAVHLWRDVLSVQRKTPPADELSLAVTLVDFGALLTDNGGAPEGESLLREGLAI